MGKSFSARAKKCKISPMAYSKTVSDDDILAVFDEIDGPVVTVPDVAERVPMSRDGIRIRLKNLEDEGRVKSKRVGSRAVVWWRLGQ
jgi:predicted transcriptional regulator